MKVILATVLAAAVVSTVSVVAYKRWQGDELPTVQISEDANAHWNGKFEEAYHRFDIIDNELRRIMKLTSRFSLRLSKVETEIEALKNEESGDER